MTVKMKCVCGGVLLSVVTIVLQQRTTVVAETPKPSPLTSEIAVIDIGRVFQRNPRFNARRDELQREIEATTAEAKTQAEVIKALEAELKKHSEGSDDFNAAADEITKAKAKLAAFAEVQKRNTLRQEQQLHLDVYRDVLAAVERYARANGIRLVLRYSDQQWDVTTLEKLVSRLNAQVVFHDGMDITDKILALLNDS